MLLIICCFICYSSQGGLHGFISITFSSHSYQSMLPLRATLFCRPLRIVRARNAGMHEACAILLVRRSATHNHLGALLLVDSPTQLSLLIAGRSWVSPRFLTSLSHRAMLIDPGKLNPLSPLIERSFMLDSGLDTPSPLACINVSRLICFR